jgi:thioredoxin 2
MSDRIQIACPNCLVANRLAVGRLGDGPTCGRCGSSLLPAAPIALDDAGFDRYLQATALPVVVDFWARWCGPCTVMAPHFAAAAGQRPHLIFAKVDTDAAPQLSQRYGIRSIPTVILFSTTREIDRRSGALSSVQLLSWLDPAVAGLGSAQ